ncbi:MAG: hypothetical protein A2008_13900 [Candidatus Wallbacteria bacterium GWC2_49_35]|uniref:Uncharacterized protein n=1 Tax=Candidatus Wallbacteria bacterium GWC2_49_35 TaxID=1817813 RepID=A0A1F7WI30_9BACT|nr:MAG: hypothetical protein A2008_13900 [Candidatus Wallbacteria bacterium GWC2_49_35]
MSNIIKLNKGVNKGPHKGGADNGSPKAKIEFTREEYNSLAELLILGEMVINSRRDESEIDHKYIDVQQKVFSHAKEAGAGDMIEFNASENLGRPTALLLEEVVWPLIDDYDDMTLWDELSIRLAERDAIAKYGREKIMLLPDAELAKIQEPLIDKYYDEFIDNGLNNVLVRGIV